VNLNFVPRVFVAKQGKIGVVLDDLTGRRRARAIWLSDPSHVAEVSRDEIEADGAEWLTPVGREIFVRVFRALACDQGYLRAPAGQLQRREAEDVGPANCWNCGETVSYERGSLECTVCHHYVCRCGRCFCTSPVLHTYRDELVPAGAGLPCPPDLRKAFVQILRRLPVAS